MRLLITGGSSYLGRHLVPLAVNHNFYTLSTYFENKPVLPGQHAQLNLEDGLAVAALVSKWKPDAVVHLAGSNRVSNMPGVIVQGTQNLCAALPPTTRLIHLSTDVIFDGLNPPYREDAPPTPVHEYGRTKAAAEQIVAQHRNHVIVRTSLIFGLVHKDRGTEGFERRLTRGEAFTLFNNQFRNPIWADTLSLACLELVKHSYVGILNVAGSEVIDRATYSQALLTYWGVETGTLLTVGADTSGRFPPDTRLDISLAKQLLETPLAGFREVVFRHKMSTDKKVN